jgi:hypothetical protein
MIHLLVNPYTSPDPARNAELEECLARNKANPLLKVHELSTVPDRPRRFSEFFAIASLIPEEWGDGRDAVVIIANADIYFDESVVLAETIPASEAWALSRWDVLPEGLVLHDNQGMSQDAWVLRAPFAWIRSEWVWLGGCFHMGVPGCDNRLAYELDCAGYLVRNPARQVKAYHLHQSGVRNYDSKTPRVPPPYLAVPVEP